MPGEFYTTTDAFGNTYHLQRFPLLEGGFDFDPANITLKINGVEIENPHKNHLKKQNAMSNEKYKGIEASRFILGRPTFEGNLQEKLKDNLEIKNMSTQGPLTTNKNVGIGRAIPHFIVPNQDQVEVVLRDAGTFEEVNEKNVDSAEAFLKAGKSLVKTVSTERLNYTRVLDGIKDEAMATEKELIAALNPIEKGINAEKKRQYDVAQAEKARLQKLEDERIAAEQKELQRKQTLANRLLKLREATTEELFNKKTEAEINSFCATLLKGNPKADVYEEKVEEAAAILKEVASRKEEALFILRNTIQAEEYKKKREEEAKARQEEVNRQAAQDLLKVAADSDIRSQVATQSVAPVKGIKVKQVPEVFDIDRLPRGYMIPNLKLIAEAIAEGVQVPGVRLVDEVSRTGR